MKKTLAVLLSLLLIIPLSGCGQTDAFSPENPVTITIWHYYASNLQAVFEESVAEFNNTRGMELGIVVDTLQVSNIDVLTDKIVASAAKEVGADPLPDLIFAYTSTVLDLDSRGLIADIAPYFTEEELGQYLPSFLEEGRMGADNALKSFPVAKSSEIVFVDNSVYSVFKEEVNAAAGSVLVNDDMLLTCEGIAQIADLYYQWTDGKTPDIPYDGKAFFGVDATPNFISVGARQLSQTPPVTVQEDGSPAFTLGKNTARALWEYYVTNIATGRFAEIGWYRADDMKTGDLIAYLGSTGGASYFPLEIAQQDGTVRQTELLVSRYPTFSGSRSVTIQQGAGMSIIKTEERRQRAAAEFLRWFTEPGQNVEYAMASGYSPVQKSEHTGELLEQALSSLESQGDALSLNISKVLHLASHQMNEYELTVDKEFPGSYDIRNMFGNKLSEAARTAKTAYEAALSGGMSPEDALKSCVNEAAFEAWYRDIQAQYNALAAGA